MIDFKGDGGGLNHGADRDRGWPKEISQREERRATCPCLRWSLVVPKRAGPAISYQSLSECRVPAGTSWRTKLNRSARGLPPAAK